MPMAYRSAPKQSSGSILEPYVPYIHRRWAEGCHNTLLQLWRAIKKKGYSGQGGLSPQVLKASAPQVGTTDARAARAIFPGAKTTFEPPASRRGAWWLLKQREDLSPERRTFVEQLCQPVSSSEKDTGDCARLSEESSVSGGPKHPIVDLRLLKTARWPSLKVLLRVPSGTTKQLE
jgi:hypothetical protein